VVQILKAQGLNRKIISRDVARHHSAGISGRSMEAMPFLDRAKVGALEIALMLEARRR
jgi:hypothetical protein